MWSIIPPSDNRNVLTSGANQAKRWAQADGPPTIAAEQNAQWINAKNIGKTKAEMIQLWNVAHPDNPIDD